MKKYFKKCKDYIECIAHSSWTPRGGEGWTSRKKKKEKKKLADWWVDKEMENGISVHIKNTSLGQLLSTSHKGSHQLFQAPSSCFLERKARERGSEQIPHHFLSLAGKAHNFIPSLAPGLLTPGLFSFCPKF